MSVLSSAIALYRNTNRAARAVARSVAPYVPPPEAWKRMAAMALIRVIILRVVEPAISMAKETIWRRGQAKVFRIVR